MDRRAEDGRTREVAEMFDKVAPRYDRLNRILSLGRDIPWRRRAVSLAWLGAGEVALDVGVGTGDLAFALLDASDATSRVIGVDVSEQMLRLVRERASREPSGERFTAQRADALALPFADASFDRVVAGFTVRNFADLRAGLAEIRRVLKPSCSAVILEFSTPPNALIRWMHGLYLNVAVPIIAAALGGDAQAYRYLPRSIAAFPDAEGFAAALRDAGFASVRFERLLFGTTAIHIARR